MPSVVDFTLFDRPNLKATRIADMYRRYRINRKGWEELRNEIREFTFQTDTTKTSVGALPWRNKTTRPKLCQIRDNLHANYISALSLSGNFMRWEGASVDDATKEKAEKITSYIKTKLEDSNAFDTISQLVYDYIDYGIAIGGVEYVTDTVTSETGETISRYIGPRIVRYSPIDVVFDVTADHFDNAPKVTRSLVGLGELKVLAEKYPEWGYDAATIDMLVEKRRMASLTEFDRHKFIGFDVDGFRNPREYYQSGYVELLTFEGDFFDITTGELERNKIITVADRMHVLSERTNPNWLGKSNKRAVVWRKRPDNLIGMGPLDNLVGMQYRLDHLENLKADVFDQIAVPMLKIKGFVDDFEFGPGEKITMGADADVEFLRPEATALQADIQIERLEASMEEMAGAPKQAMGIRTPGEKTAYEVQALDNAAGRIFQAKIVQFEREFLEPLLNLMLESARRHMNTSDIARATDSELGVEIFLNITKDDLQTTGHLKPIGARHFAERAKLVQELTQFYGSPIGQDPAVRTHLSGKRIANLFIETLDLSKFGIYEPEIRLTEQFESQDFAQNLQQRLQANSVTPTGLEGEGMAQEDPRAIQEALGGAGPTSA